MNKNLIGSVALTVVLLLGGCGGGWEKRYHLEHGRLVHAERHIKSAERAIRNLQNANRHRRQRVARLERDLAQVRRELNRVREGWRRCAAQSKPNAPTPTVRRPAGFVKVAKLRFWNPRQRKQDKTVISELRSLLARWRQCYQRPGWGRVTELPLRGAFWLVYGVRRRQVLQPQIWHSSLPRQGGAAHSSKRLGQRISQLKSCFLKVIRTLKPRPQKRLTRIAALVVVADTAARARRVKTPSFKWPWKRVTRRWSGPGQVCAMGHRGGLTLSNSLQPNTARPCRRGLRCCYPCGIQGCNSVCLRRCPRGLP